MDRVRNATAKVTPDSNTNRTSSASDLHSSVTELTKPESKSPTAKTPIQPAAHTKVGKKSPPQTLPRRSSSTMPNKEEVVSSSNSVKVVPIPILFEDVSAAAYKIRGGVLKTPCTRSQMSNMFNMEIYFKKEFLQNTGSVKERGARYALMTLSKEQKTNGVIASSTGNHALALSYHGRDLGIPVTVVMPNTAPIMKIQGCKRYGASVVIFGDTDIRSKEMALQMAKEQNFTYIHSNDHPYIIAGHGTMGLEIVDQVPNLDACIVPVGGGGLIAGTALAIKTLHPHVQIIGVEAAQCPSFSTALREGRPTTVPIKQSLADALAMPCAGNNAFATAAPLIDKMVVVNEEFIALAMLRLVELEKAVVEGAGAVGLAAILQGLLPELIGKRVVIAACGGNIDTTAFGRVIERGLAADNRLIKFTVTVSDSPGGIAKLSQMLCELGVSIKDIFHERAWLKTDVFSVQVKCFVETRDSYHTAELEEALRRNYDHLSWGPKP